MSIFFIFTISVSSFHIQTPVTTQNFCFAFNPFQLERDAADVSANQNETKKEIQDRTIDSPILLAVIRGNILELEKLIEGGVDPNWKDPEGNSLLHSAALVRNMEMTNQLIKHGCNILSRNEKGDLPFHQAVLSGSEELVLFYLEKGLNIDERGSHGRTPLIMASASGRTNLVSILLKRGASLNLFDDEGYTALLSCANTRIFSNLIRNGADINQRTDQQPPILIRAIEDGNSLWFKECLRKGANLEIENRFGWNALMLCNAYGNLDFSKELQEKGISLNETEKNLPTFLGYYAAIGDEEAVIRLLDVNKIDIDTESLNGASPLVLAAKFNKTKMCELLISRGAFIEFQDNSGMNALMYAIQTSNLSLLNLLLELKVDLKTKAQNGKTVFYFATRQDVDKTILPTLLDHGLEPDVLRWVSCCK